MWYVPNGIKPLLKKKNGWYNLLIWFVKYSVDCRSRSWFTYVQYANTWLYVSLCPVLLFFLLQLLPVFTFDLWHGWSCVTWGRQQVGRTQVAEVLGYLVHEVLKFPNIPCKILKSFIVLNIIFHNKKNNW